VKNPPHHSFPSVSKASTAVRILRAAPVVAAVAVALALLLFTDTPVMTWIQDHRAGGGRPDNDIRSNFLGWSELFAKTVSTVTICCLMLVLDARRRSRIIALLLILGIVTPVNFGLKVALGRVRPERARLEYYKRLDGRLDKLDPRLKNTVFESPYPTYFGGPVLGIQGNRFQSFPSGHAAHATAQAVVLACFYPQLKAVFYALVLLVGAERIYHEAHYPSDVFAGCALALILTRLLLRNARFQFLCERMTPARWRSGGGAAAP